ncbi:hypothetical protein MUP79_05430 [Candidatus Bathyarchaeota archaeon]|nr:hypothetical protein [Candidatus Bathyarchaeota archaeon]
MFTVQLFPGYGRWDVNFQEELESYGAPLREASDALVTRISADERVEELVLALEFCSALPAGNNAWQRNGRALAWAVAGVPYLYFAETGGVELGQDRSPKAPRFPNPIVPFSYLTASKTFNVICLPVYSPSPSSSQSIRAQLDQMFGIQEAQRLVKCILEDTCKDDAYRRLAQKALMMTEILAEKRRQLDTLRGKQWAEFLELETANDRAAWLEDEKNRMDWSKKRATKVRVTRTFEILFDRFQQIQGISVGAKDIPLCLVPHDAREDLAEIISAVYHHFVTNEFLEWLAKPDSALLIVWITGFKPRGDDSRPDRGLVPLARMLFGDEADILSIVYGPAKPATWENLRESPQELARRNGLWEAIVNLSDAILADSVTAAMGPLSLVLRRKPYRFPGTIQLPLVSPTARFSEHDVDSTLHSLFASSKPWGVFEAMCNPPGGDWSGLSILNFQSGEEFRWTSLPRVSSAAGKRPDHVIQFLLPEEGGSFLALESKDKASKLEHNVGNRLKIYIKELLGTAATVAKVQNGEWRLWQEGTIAVPNYSVLSGAAFLWIGKEDLEKSVVRGQLDIAFGVEIRSIEQSTLLHIKVGPAAQCLVSKIADLAQRLGGRIEIKVH